MGHWDPEPGGSVDDGSVMVDVPGGDRPLLQEDDAKIPIGTIIPAVLITGKHEGDRYHIKGEAHWADGHWTLMASRDLKTGSKYDQDFCPARPLHVGFGVRSHPDAPHPSPAAGAHCCDRITTRTRWLQNWGR